MALQAHESENGLQEVESELQAAATLPLAMRGARETWAASPLQIREAGTCRVREMASAGRGSALERAIALGKANARPGARRAAERGDSLAAAMDGGSSVGTLYVKSGLQVTTKAADAATSVMAGHLTNGRRGGDSASAGASRLGVRRGEISLGAVGRDYGQMATSTCV